MDKKIKINAYKLIKNHNIYWVFKKNILIHLNFLKNVIILFEVGIWCFYWVYYLHVKQ